MGNLTDDMTRLRGEVEAMRGARCALMQDLASGASELTKVVAAMRADFASAHTEMARTTSGERKSFVADVILEVNSLLGAFSSDREKMARKGRDDRGAFLAEMRREVMNLRKETAEDLMGARVVWRGQCHRKSRNVHLKSQSENVMPVPLPEEEACGKQEPCAPPLEAMKETPVELTELAVVPEIQMEVLSAGETPVELAAELETPVEVAVAEELLEVAEVTALPETSVVESAPEPVADAIEFHERIPMGEKTSKTATRGKRGRK